MRVTIKLFAVLREKARTSSLDLTLPDGASVKSALAELSRNHPELDPLLSRAAFAVNQEYRPQDTELKDGDELAIIPPVSGG